jgi:hypothetical protein
MTDIDVPGRLVVAGALTAGDRLAMRMKHGEVIEAANQALGVTSWTRSPDSVVESDFGILDAALEQAWWCPADSTAVEANQNELDEAWRQISSRPRYDAMLRLRVDSVRDALQLRALSRTLDDRVAVYVDGGDDRNWRWHWPLRVGILESPFALQVSQAVRGTGRYVDQYDVRIVGEGGLGDLDVLVVDDASEFSPSSTDIFGAIVVVGDVIDSEDSLAIEDRALHAFAADAGAIVVAVDRQLIWFERLIAELSHDRPLDCAVSLADQDAVVIGSTRFLNTTALREWAFEAANQIDQMTGAGVPGATADELRTILLSQRFDHEGSGGLATAQLVSSFEGDGDRSLEIQGSPSRTPTHRLDSVDRGGLSERPQPPHRDRPARGAVETRRLIADVWDGDKRCDAVTPPLKPLSLVVRIGTPSDGETAADTPFPDIDTDDPSVTLEAVIRSSVWPESQTAKIELSMSHRDRDSTVAAFEFNSPEQGAVLKFDITILHRGHVIHSALYTASVRTRRFPVDRVNLLCYALSSPSVPTAHASLVDVALSTFDLDLEGDGLVLRDIHGRAELPLAGVKDILKSIETVSSQFLGDDGAPDTIDDPRAAELLVKLARLGSELNRMFKDFKLPKARSVSLMVGSQTAILPLELIYVRPPPKETGARLCTHVQNPLPAGELCQLANRNVVCPYAFWGSQRTVHRTIRFIGERSPNDPVPLALDSILYAASERADIKSVGRKPSDRIERSAKELFGAQAVARVRNWRDWKRSIRDLRPRVLVLLAHSELSEAEWSLEIGDHRVLKRPDINHDFLRRSDEPPPLVILMACASAQAGDAFGTFPGVLASEGAAAVIGTITKLAGRHGAQASEAILAALVDGIGRNDVTVGSALANARRDLIAQGQILGLLLVAHGEMDTKVKV